MLPVKKGQQICREIKLLATELFKQNITGLQWVGSDAWITDDSLTDSEGHSLLVGSLGFTVSKAKIPGLEEHLRQLHPSQFPESQFVRDFWEDVFDCALNNTANTQRKPCSGFESLQTVESRGTPVCKRQGEAQPPELAKAGDFVTANGQREIIDERNCTKADTAQAILGHSASAPTLSHFATCACLSNREEFPSFFRTIPSDLHQSRALAKLVKHFSWTWVGAISNKNQYGINGITTFIQAAQEEGVCIEYYEAFEQTGPLPELAKVVESVKHSTSKVIVAFMSHREVKVLATELFRQNITGLQWVGSDAWITDDSLTDSEGHSLLVGSLGFTVSKAKIPGLEEHLRQLHPSQFPDSQFVRDFWEDVFDCALNNTANTQRKPCSGFESLQTVESFFTDVSELRFTNNVYKSVYAVAHALHSLVTCEEGRGPFYNGSCADTGYIQPWQGRRDAINVLCVPLSQRGTSKASRWNDRELKFARTLIFTVEEINRDNKLLPGVSLGYKLYNGCGSENLLRAALEAVNGEDSMDCSSQIQALIGHSSSGVSQDINTIISPLSVPQVSYFSTCACLSDRAKYPTFFRTIPSDYFQAKALAALVKRFGWQWIGAIQSDNDYGRGAADCTPCPREYWSNEGKDDFVAKGDYVIGGIFPLQFYQEMPDLNDTNRALPVKCNGLDPRAFRWAQTMRLAVEEINQRADLLPNYTLGYKIFDSCAYPLTGQRAALAILNGQSEEDSPMCPGASPLLAVIGESSSSQSIVVSRILQPFRIPMVKAIAQLLIRFQWTWVGLLRGDHEYGRFAVQGLLRELQGTKVCVAYQQVIPLLYDRKKALEILEVMRSSSAKVVVVFSAEGEMTPFLKDYMTQNITGIQWVAGEAWVTASVFTGSEFYPFLGGTIGFGIRKVNVCTLLNSFPPSFVAKGDYVIGGIFPLHYNQEMPDLNGTYRALPVKCNGFDPKAFRWAQTMRLAVEEINQRADLLPNYTLGYKIFDSCAYPLTGQRAALAVLNGESEEDSPMCPGASPLLAVIGESGSAQSIVVSRILQPFRIPMVKAIAQLIIRFQWTWVGLVRGDHEYGRFAVQGLLRELQGTNVCVAYQEMIPLLYDRKKALEILEYYLQEVQFNIGDEEVNFDLKGDSIPYYDILNWQRGTDGSIEFVNVGLFDGTKPAGEELVIQEDKIMWTGHQNSIECTLCPEDFWSNIDRAACIPKKVEFLAYDSLGIALTVISVVGACLTIAVFAVFFHHRKTVIVRVNNSELSFFTLFALTLCFLCSLLFIGEPTFWSCMLRHTAFSITFSLCISCILGKTLVVLAAFTATRPGDNIMKWLGPKQQRAIIFISTLIQHTHLRSCSTEDHNPLLRKTKALQGPRTRSISMKGQENNYTLHEEAGKTEDKANPECCLAEPTCPHRWLANEHQGTQEAQLQRQEKQETYFGVVGLDDRCGTETLKDSSDDGCQYNAKQCECDEDDAHDFVERQKFFDPSDAFHLGKQSKQQWGSPGRLACLLPGEHVNDVIERDRLSIGVKRNLLLKLLNSSSQNILTKSIPGCGEGRMFNKNSFRPGILTPGKEKPSVPSKREWKRANTMVIIQRKAL
ncbi:Extracellular calcium-sensing receptor [Liparis tanakae]|uniref:Extracellular calcium-sensing receptor n=1 Tax=Liparis tanakae TaxID=230148 RepID=A0A4Z2G1J8_9TELE|nr:Extracellular calcium-sensing receptor [Liparis tanakae]